MIRERYELLKELIDSKKFIVDTEKGKVYTKFYGYTREVGKVNKKSGYIQIGVYHENKTKIFYGHQFVAAAMGNNLIDMDVNHINYNRSDNRACNLEVITHRENSIHSAKNNAKSKRKLTDKQIENIIQERNNGASTWELSYKYNVSDTTIRNKLKNTTKKY